MKKYLTLIAVAVFLGSCADTNDPTSTSTTTFLSNVDSYELQYNGPWEVNFVSNANVFQLVGTNSYAFGDIDSFYAKKLDFTEETLKLVKTTTRYYVNQGNPNVQSIDQVVSKSVKNDTIISIDM